MGPLLMAGLGMGASALGRLLGGKPKPQVTTTSVDPYSQNYFRFAGDTAMGFAGQPMTPTDPAFLEALQRLQGYGTSGTDALHSLETGEGVMNPYMNAMNPYWDRMRADSLNSFNKTATAAGAFGARRSLGQGAALQGVNDLQGQAYASEWNNSRNALLARAQMGLNSLPMAGQMGQWLTNRPMEYRQGIMDLLRKGYFQPLSTSTTQPPQQQGSWFDTLAGGAMTGLSFYHPKAPGMPGTSAPMSGSYGPGAGGFYDANGNVHFGNGGGSFDPNQY